MLYLIDIDVFSLSGYSRGYLLAQFDHSFVSLWDVHTLFVCLRIASDKRQLILVHGKIAVVVAFFVDIINSENVSLFVLLYCQILKSKTFICFTGKCTIFIFNIVNTEHAYIAADIIKYHKLHWSCFIYIDSVWHTHTHSYFTWFRALQMLSVMELVLYNKDMKFNRWLLSIPNSVFTVLFIVQSDSAYIVTKQRGNNLLASALKNLFVCHRWWWSCSWLFGVRLFIQSIAKGHNAT